VITLDSVPRLAINIIIFKLKPKKRKIENRKNKMLKLTFLKKKQNVIFEEHTTDKKTIQ
jgi:hypothetical protein